MAVFYLYEVFVFFVVVCFFFFKQKTAYEMRISDWSSDVCSSDLDRGQRDVPPDAAPRPRPRRLLRAARRDRHRLAGDADGRSRRARPARTQSPERLARRAARRPRARPGEDRQGGGRNAQSAATPALWRRRRLLSVEGADAGAAQGGTGRTPAATARASAGGGGGDGRGPRRPSDLEAAGRCLDADGQAASLLQPGSLGRIHHRPETADHPDSRTGHRSEEHT